MIVYNLLKKYGNTIRLSGQDYVIHCLNPDHDDKNPSMRVDKDSGIFNCLSCGFKGNIFKYYGILTTPISSLTYKLKNKLDKIKASFSGLELPKGARLYTKPFKNISGKTLQDFGCFTTNLVPELTDRLIIPIYDVTGKIHHFVARHLFSNESPKYLVLPRNSEFMCYPQKVPSKYKCIILVEGIFDMLKLHSADLKCAVSTFGVSTLNKDTKEKLQTYLIQGINKIYILYDGDKAGRKSARILKPIIEETCNIEVEIIDLPDEIDPNTMSLEDLKHMRDYIEENNCIN